VHFAPDYSALRKPEGGSLNGTYIKGEAFVKDYTGDLRRGYLKLIMEMKWLTDLPVHVAARFPSVLLFRYDPTQPHMELRLSRIRHPALAKAILLGKVRPHEVGELLNEIFKFLLTELYPLRRAAMAGPDLWRTYHATRMEESIRLLSAVPGIRDLLTVTELEVNGMTCPSAGETLRWMEGRAHKIFGDSQLAAGHGDVHLDNIMFAPGTMNFWLVDPRGEAVLPPHYDYAKTWKALRTGYDPVHYGFYAIKTEFAPSGPKIQFEVSNHFATHYDAGLAALHRATPDYARAEGVTVDAFIAAARVAVIAHVISFASYHANRPAGCDFNRVTAYLATAALLARELMASDTPDLTARLPIWGPGDQKQPTHELKESK
jgi:hypothetical protein